MWEQVTCAFRLGCEDGEAERVGVGEWGEGVEEMVAQAFGRSQSCCGYGDRGCLLGRDEHFQRDGYGNERWIWMKMRMSRRDARWRLPTYESPVSDLCVEPGERCRKQAELI